MHHFKPKCKIISPFYRRNMKLSQLVNIKDNGQITYRISAVKHGRIIDAPGRGNNNTHVLAALIYFFICSVSKAIAVSLHKIQLLLKLVRIPNIVTVKKRNIVAVCHIHSSVACRGGAEVSVGFKQTYSVVVLCHNAHCVNRTVRGFVIGNNKLPVAVGLTLHGSYALDYVIRTVIRRHYY